MTKNRKSPAHIIEQEKLIGLLSEINADSRPDDGILVCETEYTMARIKAFSDFMYILKMRPWQNACYYAAGAFFLLSGAAVWTKEWIRLALFALIFLILCGTPRRLRTRYFCDNADILENYYSKIIGAEFSENCVKLSAVTPPPPDSKEPEQRSPITEIPYENISYAVECSHSFYIFPKNSETVICDKALFKCGTPMGLRDFLARKLGRKFKIKIKKG